MKQYSKALDLENGKVANAWWKQWISVGSIYCRVSLVVRTWQKSHRRKLKTLTHTKMNHHSLLLSLCLCQANTCIGYVHGLVHTPDVRMFFHAELHWFNVRRLSPLSTLHLKKKLYNILPFQRETFHILLDRSDIMYMYMCCVCVY